MQVQSNAMGIQALWYDATAVKAALMVYCIQILCLCGSSYTQELYTLSIKFYSIKWLLSFQHKVDGSSQFLSNKR